MSCVELKSCVPSAVLHFASVSGPRGDALHSGLFFWALAFLGLLTMFTVTGDECVGDRQLCALGQLSSPFTMCEMGGRTSWGCFKAI